MSDLKHIEQEVDKLFKKTVEELKRGNRPRLKLSKNQIDDFEKLWSSYQNLDDEELKKKLTPLLGILDHAINSSPALAEHFVRSLKIVKDRELLVYLLSGASKHVIEEKQKRGERADHEFLTALEITLEHSSSEVLEWSLRLIEQLGSQSIYFKQKVIARKPSFLASLHKHGKAARQLTDYLEKRWTPKGRHV